MSLLNKTRNEIINIIPYLYKPIIDIKDIFEKDFKEQALLNYKNIDVIKKIIKNDIYIYFYFNDSLYIINIENEPVSYKSFIDLFLSDRNNFISQKNIKFYFDYFVVYKGGLNGINPEYSLMFSYFSNILELQYFNERIAFTVKFLDLTSSVTVHINRSDLNKNLISLKEKAHSIEKNKNNRQIKISRNPSKHKKVIVKYIGFPIYYPNRITFLSNEIRNKTIFYKNKRIKEFLDENNIDSPISYFKDKKNNDILELLELIAE